MTWRVVEGDCLERLAELPDESVHCVITSPPYFGLRNYQVAGQIGLESTPEEYVAKLVAVFREVRRVLRSDGALWINLGDSYNTRQRGNDNGWDKSRLSNPSRVQKAQAAALRPRPRYEGSKPKDLIGSPWMVAFALRADGWYLRSDVIWSKPAPMPESVRDRPTSAHEHIFLLAKSPRYFYDGEAIREPGTGRTSSGVLSDREGNHQPDGRAAFATTIPWENPEGGRQKRNVWEVASQPYAAAHFATFPPKLVEPCVLATAPAQTCADCGAPYERVVEGRESTWPERKAAGATWGNVENAASNGGTQRVVHGEGVSRDLTPSPARTVGWEPTCGCEAESAPGVVLDPFCGSGTVGVVCEWYGRSFIGIELNAEYAEMARQRIEAEGRLGRRAHRPEPVEGQEPLFA